MYTCKRSVETQWWIIYHISYISHPHIYPSLYPFRALTFSYLSPLKQWLQFHLSLPNDTVWNRVAICVGTPKLQFSMAIAWKRHNAHHRDSILFYTKKCVILFVQTVYIYTRTVGYFMTCQAHYFRYLGKSTILPNDVLGESWVKYMT